MAKTSQVLRQRIAALPDQNVTWIDSFVSDRKLIRSFLAAGDIYAFPSRSEGMPNAPVEAMAAGLPVVAADASGVRDIFKDGEVSGGVVVPTDDVRIFCGCAGPRSRRREFAAHIGGRWPGAGESLCV